uniref:glycosyltransferase family 4 protein n=1 Tax=Pedobacter schmidteae TaxID=2201271 RepID=UPI000EB0FDA9|nr:glycosyltransferase family 4 protein [Pedobacter schmidteae]
MPKKILFLSPETFSGTGGIQNMSRTLAYTLHQLGKKNNWTFNHYSLNDQPADLITSYLPASLFKGFGKNKVRFTLQSIWCARNADVLILGHVNLSMIGEVLSWINPGCKIWLIAHGIEVWRPLQGSKKSIWKIANQIICVSNFTKKQVVELHHASPVRCIVLNNILDPFIKLPEKFEKPAHLLKRYALTTSQKVVFSLTRMSAAEKFKGYEQVISAISRIKPGLTDIRYLLAGPCDMAEKRRIEQFVARHGLSSNVILTDYIEASELADHFLLADLFVLPSKKEGFGIVFIEAMASGLPVICGHSDGSTDAVRHSGMGTTIDPDDIDALELAIRKELHRTLKAEERRNIQQECLKHFNSQRYASVLTRLIHHETAN